MSTKRVTSLDVARRAGVSRTTVSFVLNDVEGMQISKETRERVLEAARQLGYVPDAAAQALASGKTHTIGLLLARRPHAIAADMYLNQIMGTLVREFNRLGMRLMLQIVEDFDNREAYLKLVRSNSIDGILYSGPRVDDEALVSLIEHGVPTVLMGALPGPSYYCVDIDNRVAARRAVDHLIRLGHSRIACITNAKPTYSAPNERLLGYQDALTNAGNSFDPALVRYGDFEPESGYHQMNALLAAGAQFSAVFVASDVVAFGVMAAIREHNLRIPQDIALVGFDDVPISRYVDPSLTTVHIPIEELARCAGEMVVDLVRGVKPSKMQVLLDAHLLVRKSCGSPSAALPE